MKQHNGSLCTVLAFVASLWLHVFALGPAIAAEPVQFPVEIQGPSHFSEGWSAPFAAVLPDRPVRWSSDGYSPPINADRGGLLPAFWEGPVDFVWNFGDGSSPVTIHDHGSVEHAYSQQGTYRIALQVRDERGLLASATYPVEVKNRNPADAWIAAIQTDPDEQIVEFTGTADDAPGDVLTYHWDFGDGDSDQGEDQWRVRHQYVAPGRYEATLTVTDGDGGSVSTTHEVVITGVGDGTASVPTSIAGDEDTDKEDTEVTGSAFEAAITGGVSASFDGEMRALKGIHLMHTSTGVCRFVFSAWDDARLAYVMAILDLDNLPPDGAHYVFKDPLLVLSLEPNRRLYDAAKQRLLGRPFAAGGVGSVAFDEMVAAIAGRGEASESQRKAWGDRLGLDVEPHKRAEGRAPEAATSPFDIEATQSFRPTGGRLDLRFVPGLMAQGTLKLAMANTLPDSSVGLAALSLEGTFSLDLESAKSDGIIRYDGCEPPGLQITGTNPVDGEKHLRSLRPVIRVSFDQEVDPKSIDGSTFQLTYPDPASGQPVAVPSRILPDPKTVRLRPEADLETGVRYTVRVKTGDDGVRSRRGSVLADAGSGWHSFTFATKIDFGARGQYLACSLYQTVRDARLIEGKPALARVFADWRPSPKVHESAQVKDFAAEVVLWDGARHQVATTQQRFVRPDLWKARGISTAKAEHSAQVYGWSPDSDRDGRYSVALKVETKPGTQTFRYFASCPTSYWNFAPIVSVDYFILKVGEWRENPAELEAIRPVVQHIVDETDDYAVQLFPIVRLEHGPPKVLEIEGQQPPPQGCDAPCLMTGVKDQLQRESRADFVVAFAPHGMVSSGFTGPRLRKGQAVIISLVGRSRAYFPRYLEALVHEMGHGFGLEHIPKVTAAERKQAEDLREGSAPLRYNGIEGFRLTRAGDAGWNKSAHEGNEQGDWLEALMYPTTIPADEAFIGNASYLQVQGLFEELNWSKNDH